MSGFLTAVLAVGVVLGFMILIHEFGHYAVAKLFGVRVEQFSIGFGKRLFGFRKGETDYRINAMPLGGYVKMSGENPMDERTGDPGEFMSHPRWQRFLIAIAGPGDEHRARGRPAHRAFTWCTTSIRLFWTSRRSIGWVMQDRPRPKPGFRPATASSASTASRIRPGNRSIPREALSPNQPLDVTIERGGQFIEQDDRARSRTVPNRWAPPAGCPKQPQLPITDLEPGMPAEKAGMKWATRLSAWTASRFRRSRP